MTDSAGRVTYGAGYEDDERSTASGVKETAQDVAGAVVDTAQAAVSATAGAAGAVVDTAQDAVSATAGAVGQAAGAVVDTAQDAVSATAGAVGQVASAVADTAQKATSTVTNAVAGKVDVVAEAAAGKVEQLADTVIDTAYGSDVSPGTRAVAETTVNVLDRTAQYLRDGDLSVIFEDLRGIVRQHPLRSLVLGLSLGYLARSTFFPAAPTPTNVPRPRGGVPPMPMSQNIPVYGGAGYDTGRDVGYDAYTGTADVDTLSTIPLTDDVLAIDTIGVDDELTSFGTMGMGADDDMLAIDTLGMGDDLTSIDTAGMRSDTSDSFLSGSGTDLMDAGSSGSMIGSDIGTSGAGTATVDDMNVDAIDMGLTDQSGASGDLSSSTTSTMPTEDQLRQWDSGSSGRSNS